MKKVEDVYGIKLNVDGGVPISEKLLEVYGVNQSYLKSLVSEAEKRSYIVQTMNSRIDILLKEWTDKVKAREKRVE